AARGSQGTSTLQGTLTLTLVNGVATFTDLSYNKAETLNIQFSTNQGGVGSATCKRSVVSPAAASPLVINSQTSSSADAGGAFATQQVLKEEDAFGNIITTDNSSTVTAARGSQGTSTLQGTTTVTLVNGVATFSGLFYTKAETLNIAFSSSQG